MNLVNVLSRTIQSQNTDIKKDTSSIRGFNNATAFSIGRVKNSPLPHLSKVSEKADHFSVANTQQASVNDLTWVAVNHVESGFQPVDKGIFERDLIENPDRANLSKLLKSHFGEQILLDKLKRQKNSSDLVCDENTLSEQAEYIDGDLWYDANEENVWCDAAKEACGSLHEAWNDITDGLWLPQNSAEALWNEEIRQNQNDWFSAEEDIWQHALQLEEETCKNPAYKLRIDLNDARHRDGLFSKSDAIESAVSLVTNTLAHFNRIGHYLSDNLHSPVSHQQKSTDIIRFNQKEENSLALTHEKIGINLPIGLLFPAAQAVPVPAIKNSQAVEYAKQYAQWQQESTTQQAVNSTLAAFPALASIDNPDSMQILSRLYGGVDRLAFMQGFFNLALHAPDLDLLQQDDKAMLSNLDKAQECELAVHNAFEIKLTLLAKILFAKTLKTLQLDEQVQVAETEDEKQALINKLVHEYKGIEQTIYFTYAHFYKKFQHNKSIDLNGLSENESAVLLNKLAAQKDRASALASLIGVTSEVKDKYEFKVHEFLKAKLAEYQQSTDIISTDIAKDGKARVDELELTVDTLSKNSKNSSKSSRRIKRRAYGLPGAFNAMRIQLALTLRDKIARTHQEKLALIRQAVDSEGPRDRYLTFAAGDALKDVLSTGPMAPLGAELKGILTNYDLPEHTTDFLQYHLPSKGLTDAYQHAAIFKHCDPRELFQIMELFSPELQFGDMLLQLESQIIQLIMDKDMTEQQQITFRTNYLQSFKARILSMSENERATMGIRAVPNGMMMGYSGSSFQLLADGFRALTGGHFGVALLAQQISDLNQGLEMSSLSVKEIHWLELGASVYSTAISFVPFVGPVIMLLSGSLDFISAIEAGKSDICEYIKNGITVGMGGKGFVHSRFPSAKGLDVKGADVEEPRNTEGLSKMPSNSIATQVHNYLTTSAIENAELKSEFDLPTNSRFAQVKIKGLAGKRSVELNAKTLNLVSEPNSHHLYRLQRENGQFQEGLYIEKPAGYLKKVQDSPVDLSETLAYLNQLNNEELKTKLENVLAAGQAYLLKKRMQNIDLSELSVDLKQGFGISSNEVLHLQYRASEGVRHIFGLQIEVNGHPLILDINAQAHSPHFTSPVVLMEQGQWKNTIIDAAPEKGIEEKTMPLEEYSKLFDNSNGKASFAKVADSQDGHQNSNFGPQYNSPFEMPNDPQLAKGKIVENVLKGMYQQLDSLAHTEVELEERQKARDQEYEDYQEFCRAKRGTGSSKGCATYPSSTFTDLLNKDYKENAQQWAVTNSVTSSLYMAMLGGKLSSSEFDKASELLTQNNRFRDYFTLFNIERRPSFAFDKPLSRTGFLSFTAKKDPSQVIHTVYVHAPKTGVPTLFTEGRLDLDTKLDSVSKGKPAATVFGYELTTQAQEALKKWCDTNGYDAKFTGVNELVRKVQEHPYSELMGDKHHFMSGFDVSLQKNGVLVITGNGEESLSAMPSGLMTAKNIAQYLQHNHLDKLLHATKVDLHMNNSGKAGVWNSQAQEMANCLGLPVIGYEKITNNRGVAEKTSTSSENSETFYPQTGNKRILTKTMNEMVGDKQRSNFLRVQPEWEKVPIKQLFDRIQEYPKGFLETNALVTTKLDASKPVFLSETGEHKYQISNVATAKSSEIKLGYIQDVTETEFDLSTSEGTPLSSIDSNFLSTAPLMGGTVAVKTIGSETYMVHIQPSGELGDPNRDVNLQGELETYGWHTLGPKDYRESPTSVFGVKEDERWHFYEQRTLLSTPWAKEIFKNTETKRPEDLTSNQALKDKIRSTEEDLSYSNFEGGIQEHSEFSEVKGISESDKQLLKEQFAAYPDLLAKIESSALISTQEIEKIATDSSTNDPYPLVAMEGESQRYALVYTDHGTELLFKEEVKNGKKDLVLVDGASEQADKYEITKDGNHVKRQENSVSFTLTTDDIRAKLRGAVEHKVRTENLLQDSYEQKEELMQLQESLEKNIPEIEKLLQASEALPKITEYVSNLKIKLQAVKERISAIETFRHTGLKKINELSNLVQFLKQELSGRETFDVMEERMKIAHKQVSSSWVAYEKAANAFYSSEKKTPQLINLKEDKELKWGEYERDLDKLEDLKEQNQILKKGMITQEVNTIENAADNMEKGIEEHRRCRRANGSCSSSTSQADSIGLPLNQELENDFWREFDTPLSEKDFKQAFGKLLKTNCEINTELEEQVRGMQDNNLEKLKVTSHALFRRILSYKAKNLLHFANKILHLTKSMPHTSDSKALAVGRDQVFRWTSMMKQSLDEIFVQDYGKYQELINGELDTLSQAQVSKLLRRLKPKLEKAVQSASQIHIDFASLKSNLPEFKQLINEVFEENIFDTLDPANAGLINEAYRASLFEIASAGITDPVIENSDPAEFDTQKAKSLASFYLRKSEVALNQLKILKVDLRSKILQLMQLEAANQEKTAMTRFMLGRTLKKCADKILEYNLYLHILGGPKKEQLMPGWTIDDMRESSASSKKLFKKAAESLAKSLDAYNQAANSDEVKASVEDRLQKYLQASGRSILNGVLSDPAYKDLVKESQARNGQSPQAPEQAQAANIPVRTVDPNPLNPRGVEAFHQIAAAIDGSEEAGIIPASFIEGKESYPAKFYAMKLAITSRHFVLSLFKLKTAVLKSQLSKNDLPQLISAVKHANERIKLSNIFAERKEDLLPPGKPVSKLATFVNRGSQQLGKLEQEIRAARDNYLETLRTSGFADSRVNAELREQMKSFKGAKIILTSILNNKEYLTDFQGDSYVDIGNDIEATNPEGSRDAKSSANNEELLMNAMRMLGISKSPVFVHVSLDGLARQAPNNPANVGDVIDHAAHDDGLSRRRALNQLTQQFLQNAKDDTSFSQDVAHLMPKLSARGIEIFNKIQSYVHGEPLIQLSKEYLSQLTSPTRKSLVCAYNARFARAAREFVRQLSELKLQMLDVMRLEITMVPENKAHDDIKFWQVSHDLTVNLRNLVRKGAEYERLRKIVEQKKENENPDRMTSDDAERAVQRLNQNLAAQESKSMKARERFNESLRRVEGYNLNIESRIQKFFQSNLYLKIVLETLGQEQGCSNSSADNLAPPQDSAPVDINNPSPPLDPAPLQGIDNPIYPQESDLLADIMREVGIELEGETQEAPDQASQGNAQGNAGQGQVLNQASQGNAQGNASQRKALNQASQGNAQGNASQRKALNQASQGNAQGNAGQGQSQASDSGFRGRAESTDRAELTEKFRLLSADTQRNEARKRYNEFKRREQENENSRLKLEQQAQASRNYEERLAKERLEMKKQLKRGNARKQELAEQKRQAQLEREKEANRAGAVADLGDRNRAYSYDEGYDASFDAKKPRLEDDGDEFSRLLQSLEIPDINEDVDAKTDFASFLEDVVIPDAFLSDTNDGADLGNLQNRSPRFSRSLRNEGAKSVNNLFRAKPHINFN